MKRNSNICSWQLGPGTTHICLYYLCIEKSVYAIIKSSWGITAQRHKAALKDRALRLPEGSLPKRTRSVFSISANQTQTKWRNMMYTREADNLTQNILSLLNMTLIYFTVLRVDLWHTSQVLQHSFKIPPQLEFNPFRVSINSVCWACAHFIDTAGYTAFRPTFPNSSLVECISLTETFLRKSLPMCTI